MSLHMCVHDKLSATSNRRAVADAQMEVEAFVIVLNVACTGSFE
ncbi:hypothetical protein QN372_17990 [Undibacterium sp. RTI2.1]|nr:MULTISPECIES: hypothetical protein [unclassified Undibacterium]MDY7536964.1 hypothetical protein [Undibacterium sp. 5I1]MEB0032643.1 hypothetical protein [Undibacterium sp. RTI2.1]MEB0117997.1 hypothetical protein [Undibacterium sp. RTI2.2]MEB0229504.1 hypothetical protein [Undibacterium sp. 10I3]MEB0258857.1 hypothetical protein [Undibacterium sp. 5I1]